MNNKRSLEKCLASACSTLMDRHLGERDLPAWAQEFQITLNGVPAEGPSPEGTLHQLVFVYAQLSDLSYQEFQTCCDLLELLKLHEGD